MRSTERTASLEGTDPDLAAGFPEDDVGRAGVPLHGGGEAGVKVSRTARQFDEFEGAAPADGLRAVEAAEVGFRFGAEVAAAGEYPQARIGEREGGRPQRYLTPGGADEEGTAAPRAHEKLVGDRHVDEAQDGCAGLDEGDVDGKIAVALDEFLGAVQRIDEPEAVKIFALGVGDLLVLLGDDGVTGGQVPEAGDDDVVGGAIGAGEGRFVGLDFDAEVFAVIFSGWHRPPPG